MKKIQSGQYGIPKEWRDELYRVELSKIMLTKKLESNPSKSSLIAEKRDEFISSTVSFFGSDF